MGWSPDHRDLQHPRSAEPNPQGIQRAPGEYQWFGLEVNNDLNSHCAQGLLSGPLLSLLWSRERFPNWEAYLFCHSIRVLFPPVDKIPTAPCLCQLGNMSGSHSTVYVFLKRGGGGPFRILGSHYATETLHASSTARFTFLLYDFNIVLVILNQTASQSTTNYVLFSSA